MVGCVSWWVWSAFLQTISLRKASWKCEIKMSISTGQTRGRRTKVEQNFVRSTRVVKVAAQQVKSCDGGATSSRARDTALARGARARRLARASSDLRAKGGKRKEANLFSRRLRVDIAVLAARTRLEASGARSERESAADSRRETRLTDACRRRRRCRAHKRRAPSKVSKQRKAR